MVRSLGEPLTLPETSQPPSRNRFAAFAKDFAFAALWIGVFSAPAAGFSRQNYLAIFAGFFVLAFGPSGLIFLWIALRAEQPKGRIQFAIAFLLVLTLWAAIFLGTLRWLVLALTDRIDNDARSTAVYIAVAIFCVYIAIISTPLTLRLLNSLIWLLASLVRQRWIQARLARYRSRLPK